MISNQEINTLNTFAGSSLNAEAVPNPFLHNCPSCHGKQVKANHSYHTKHKGARIIYICQDCGVYFFETYGTPIAGLTTPLTEIVKVLKVRMEELGLNAATRVFGYSKNTILNWERRLAILQETLFLYALAHEFWQLTIEGDELYTKVK